MARFNVVGMAAVGFGGLLLYSAVKGIGFSAGLRDILSGQKPNTNNLMYPISETPGSVTTQQQLQGSPGNLGFPNVTNPATSSEEDWIKTVLTAIGAPSTQANINSVKAWIQKESVYPGNGQNTGGLFNPLNTTRTASGATDYNSVGVKNYVSEVQGLSATVATLLQGNYNDIVGALRSGNGLCGQSFQGFLTWSGNGYSRVC